MCRRGAFWGPDWRGPAGGAPRLLEGEGGGGGGAARRRGDRAGRKGTGGPHRGPRAVGRASASEGRPSRLPAFRASGRSRHISPPHLVPLHGLRLLPLSCGSSATRAEAAAAAAAEEVRSPGLGRAKASGRRMQATAAAGPGRTGGLAAPPSRRPPAPAGRYGASRIPWPLAGLHRRAMAVRTGSLILAGADRLGAHRPGG